VARTPVPAHDERVEMIQVDADGEDLFHVRELAVIILERCE
jgi:hypothetical protein